MRIVNEDVLDRFRAASKCEWCGRSTLSGAHPHHIFARGRGDAFRMDVAKNLISLDAFCHAKVHSGEIKMRQLLEIVAKREGVDVGELESELRALRWK